MKSSERVSIAIAGALILMVVGGARADEPRMPADSSGFACWDFDSADEYVFDAAKIEVASGAASLRSAAGWPDTRWPYRRTVTLRNGGESACEQCQWEVSLDESSFDFLEANADGGDLRFAPAGQEDWLEHWIESYDPGEASALVTLRLPWMAPAADAAAGLYYGYAAAPPHGSWAGTFRAGPPEPRSATILDGSPYDAFPTLERLPGGEILVAFRQGSAHASPDGRIALGRSTDGGTTWTSQVVFDDPAMDDRANLGLTRLSDGTLLLPFFQHDGFYPTRCFFLRSTDGGGTWSGAAEIPSVFTGWMAVYGRVIETPQGTLYLPAYGQDTSLERMRSVLLESEDGGWTWSLRSVIASGPDPFDEASVLPLGAGRLLAIVRCETVPPTLYSVESLDDGLTWGAPGILHDGASPCLLRLADGSIVLASTDRVGIAGIRFSLSSDEGVTWSSAVLVDPDVTTDDLGYPSCVERADGSLLTAHYKGGAGIRCTVVPEAFIGSNPNYHNSYDGLEEEETFENSRLWRLSGWPEMVNRAGPGRTGDAALVLDDVNATTNPTAMRTLYAIGMQRGRVSFWARPETLVTGAEFGLAGGYEAQSAPTQFWFRIAPGGGLDYRTKSGEIPCARWQSLAPPGSIESGTWSKLSIRFNCETREAAVFVNGVEVGVADPCSPSGDVAFLAFAAGTPASTGDRILIDDIYTSQFSEPDGPALVGAEETVYPTDAPALVTPSRTMEDLLEYESFTEDGDRGGGDILYQLSDDEGGTWRFWDGAEWREARFDVAEANTAAAVNAHIGSFPTGSARVALRAFLRSDGRRPVRLEHVEIGYRSATAPETEPPFFVGAARPTPTPGRTAIPCVLPVPAEVAVRICDVGGREVRRIGLGLLTSGPHEIVWDGRDGLGRDVAAGVYHYVVEAGARRGRGRFVVLR